MSLLATCLAVLYLCILPLEASRLLFHCHCLIHKVIGTVFLIDPCAEEFCWALDDSSGLGERGYLAFSGVFLIVSMGIEDRPHLDELEVTLELGSQVRLW